MTRLENYSEQNPATENLTGSLVIGMSDGLIIPFALAAGLSGYVESNHIIIISGIAAITAGSIAMGFGGYYSGKPEQDHHSHHLTEEKETTGDPDETRKFFANLGLSESLQEQAMSEVMKDKDKWVAFKKQYEQGSAEADTGNAARSGWLIGFGYVIGGLITLTPYFLFDTPMESLKYSAVISLLFLLIAGWIKGKLTGIPAWWSAVRLMITGLAAAAAAYGVAQIFQTA